PDLQVETTTLGKHGSEEQFPVKEALLVSDLLADTQPGVLDQDVGRFPGTSKRKVEFLSGAQFVPVRAGGEGGVAAAPGAAPPLGRFLRPVAEHPLQGAQ